MTESLSDDLAYPSEVTHEVADHAYLAPPPEWRDRNAWQFECFFLHSHHITCINCGAVTHYSEFYRAFRHKNRAPYDTIIRKAPIGPIAVDPSVPVVLLSLPERKTPICHHCLTASREGTLRLVSDLRRRVPRRRSGAASEASQRGHRPERCAPRNATRRRLQRQRPT